MFGSSVYIIFRISNSVLYSYAYGRNATTTGDDDLLAY